MSTIKSKIKRSSNSEIKRIFSKMKEESYELPRFDPFDQLKDTPTMYRPVEADEFPFGQYFLHKTGRPITHHYRQTHDSGGMSNIPVEAVESFLLEFPLFKEIFSSDIYDTHSRNITRRSIFEMADETGAILIVLNGLPQGKVSRKREIHITAVIVSNINEDVYTQVRAALLKRYKKVFIPSNNVNLVITSPSGYDTEPFSLPKQKIDIELNYGEKFGNIHKTIIESLNKQKGKGLVLLHGTPGTGKTHYLKYLASRIKGKKVLFIPPYLADFITSPEMTPFLIDNSNSVLFIEDAERAIVDRNEGGTTGVSNILNITDGILSDILNIQIVATFNMDRQKIDPALLRKGRLIAEHKFDALSVEESNKLLNHLGIDYITTIPMTLTEIYNVKDQHFISEPTKNKKIGFSIG